MAYQHHSYERLNASKNRSNYADFKLHIYVTVFIVILLTLQNASWWMKNLFSPALFKQNNMAVNKNKKTRTIGKKFASSGLQLRILRSNLVLE